MDHKFLSAIEQRSKMWDSWDQIQKWHDVHLKTMKPLPVDCINNMLDKPQRDSNKKVVCGVELGLIKSSHLCVKYDRMPVPWILAIYPPIEAPPLSPISMPIVYTSVNLRWSQPIVQRTVTLERFFMEGVSGRAPGITHSSPYT